jgi:hypothetical protein
LFRPHNKAGREKEKGQECSKFFSWIWQQRVEGAIGRKKSSNKNEGIFESVFLIFAPF